MHRYKEDASLPRAQGTSSGCRKLLERRNTSRSLTKPEEICRKAQLCGCWKLQQKNDPKHIAKVVQKSFKEDISVLEWHTQSPDLENLWRDLKARVMARKPTNLTQLESFAKEK